MAARDDLLAALRRAAPTEEIPLPDLSKLGTRFDDPAAQLVRAVESVGGTCVRVPDRAAAGRALAERGARRIVSLVPEVMPGNVDLAAIADPHDLEGVDLAVLPGEFAVAENGAVWVDAAALPHRAIFVIAEHLVLVVTGIVNDMHAAYAMLADRPVGYGTFIAGPSKTADIEQALVIGAHGPRSCTVVLVES